MRSCVRHQILIFITNRCESSSWRPGNHSSLFIAKRTKHWRCSSIHLLLLLLFITRPVSQTCIYLFVSWSYRCVILWYHNKSLPESSWRLLLWNCAGSGRVVDGSFDNKWSVNKDGCVTSALDFHKKMRVFHISLGSLVSTISTLLLFWANAFILKNLNDGYLMWFCWIFNVCNNLLMCYTVQSLPHCHYYNYG